MCSSDLVLSAVVYLLALRVRFGRARIEKNIEETAAEAEHEMESLGSEP